MLRRNKPLQRKKALGPGKKALAKTGWKKTAKTAARHTGQNESDDSVARAHAVLWPLLAQREAFPFVEYQRLGPYVVDFYCPAAKLVVAITGSDESDAWFAQNGYRLLSFAAPAVISDPQAVLASIAESFGLRLVGR